tara:strand:- start:80 stop:511 length:432 start_codon:yes stop_codon:yes gene_type:complete
MNTKNILIAFVIIGGGVILYKLLLGFVLPIALFVALGYVLKFLLKGSDSESVQDVSQVLTKSQPPSSLENIVEIKPIEEGKRTKEDETIEEINPIEEVNATKEDESTKEIKPIEEYKTSNEDKPIEEIKPTEEDRTTKEDKTF